LVSTVFTVVKILCVIIDFEVFDSMYFHILDVSSFTSTHKILTIVKNIVNQQSCIIYIL